ncbi:NUDIX hydrolase [Microtetraspora malaysiensis]|uniref:NUDIX hydrolase n=1 Tax=Microtetraspora malaysiensis TaxID=161358 RepID=UPI003D8F319A
MHSVSVSGVILDGHGRALLIQRRDIGRWEAPGGVLERDEDIISGLLREVREETGLDVTPQAMTGVYKNMTRGIIALVFRCEAVGGQLSVNDEACAFRWATADEVRDLAAEAYAVRVLDAIQPLSSPAVRAHDGVRIIIGDCAPFPR